MQILTIDEKAAEASTKKNVRGGSMAGVSGRPDVRKSKKDKDGSGSGMKSAKQIRADAEKRRQSEIREQEERDDLRVMKERRNQEAAKRAAAAADRASKAVASLQRKEGRSDASEKEKEMKKRKEKERVRFPGPDMDGAGSVSALPSGAQGEIKRILASSKQKPTNTLNNANNAKGPALGELRTSVEYELGDGMGASSPLKQKQALREAAPSPLKLSNMAAAGGRPPTDKDKEKEKSTSKSTSSNSKSGSSAAGGSESVEKMLADMGL